jgi:5-methylcytosine-specific restriction endonuclease McrA
MPQSFCTICRARIPRGSRCARHRIVSPSSKAWSEPGAARVRRETLARDGGCVICRRTEHLEVHHLVAAADGGPTAPSNCVTLCGSCHVRVERGEAEIPGHIHRTEPPEGLRTPQVCAADVTQRGPNWAS